MRRPGKGLATLALACGALLWSSVLWSAVTASVDRDRVALGDSLLLTLLATEGEDLAAAELRPLLADFRILQRSSSSQTRIVNGRKSHTRELQLELAPQRTGTLRIPALQVDGARTAAIEIRVAEAPELDTGDAAVLFTAELDRQSVYVQGQVLLTLRVMQAINLEDRSISELQLDDAFVRPLEQHSFRRDMDGRPWLVHEVRYAIFPKRSGRLEIPAQVFTAREIGQRRGVFGLGSGRRLRRTTEPLAVEVLPRPASFPDGAAWLPARQLTIEETWSTPPDALRVGGSTTRTITLRGTGLQGAQLPPVLFKPLDGIRFYPDQPRIEDQESADGLRGLRSDSAAIVPLEAGDTTLPEIRIPWWDTEAERVRYAVLPARQLAIAPAAQASTNDPPATPSGASPALSGGGEAAGEAVVFWRQLATVTGLGWLATLAYLLYAWHRRRATGGAAAEDAPAARASEAASERQCHRRLQRACAAHEPAEARAALLDWARAASGRADIRTLAALHELWPDDAALARETAALDAALYRDAGTWRGDGLAQVVGRLRAAPRRAAATASGFDLYPRTSRRHA